MTKISQSVVILLGLLVAVAILSKVIGCGLPGWILTKSRRSGWRIGVEMTSRGEVGLVIAGIGLTSGVLAQDVYAALVGTIILTTIVSPILLKSAYKGEQLAEPAKLREQNGTEESERK